MSKQEIFNQFKEPIFLYLLNYHDVTFKQFNENINNRKQPYTFIKQVMMSLANEYGYTTIQSGKMYNKDHSTVIHANKLIKDLSYSDKNIRLLMNIIYSKIEKIKNQIGIQTEPFFVENLKHLWNN